MDLGQCRRRDGGPASDNAGDRAAGQGPCRASSSRGAAAGRRGGPRRISPAGSAPRPAGQGDPGAGEVVVDDEVVGSSFAARSAHPAHARPRRDRPGWRRRMPAPWRRRRGGRARPRSVPGSGPAARAASARAKRAEALCGEAESAEIVRLQFCRALEQEAARAWSPRARWHRPAKKCASNESGARVMARSSAASASAARPAVNNARPLAAWASARSGSSSSASAHWARMVSNDVEGSPMHSR